MSDAGPRVAVATAPEERELVYRIRHAVFVLEQAVPIELERDDDDEHAEHFLARSGGTPAGAGRLVVESGEDGRPVGHLGRLAVLAPYRGEGLGAALVRAIESSARDRGMTTIILSSQVPAVPFYERLGYAAYGDIFDDAGIPHRAMRRRDL